jgi:hypothetical protein
MDLKEKLISRKTDEIYDYRQMVRPLEEKYGINTDHYVTDDEKARLEAKGWKTIFEFNAHHRTEWEHARYPQIIEMEKNPVKGYRFHKAGRLFLESPEGIKFWNDLRHEYEKDPDDKARETPYRCLWDFMSDFFNAQNGTLRTFSWLDVVDAAESQPWVQDIAELFIKEYGTDEYTVIISW